MKKSKKILIILGIIIVVIWALIASGVLTFHFSVNRTDDKVNLEKPANYETAEFKSKYGFTMTYPKNWIVDTSEKIAPLEVIREPLGKAYITIQSGYDERLKVFSSRAQAMIEAEQKLTANKQYKLDLFKWTYETPENPSNMYAAMGSFNDKNGVNWQFEEVGVFDSTGMTTIFQGSFISEFSEDYIPIIEKIFSSFKPTKITAELAQAEIESLPEVKEYEKNLADSGKKAIVEVEDAEDNWNVHVFEIIKESDRTSHTATFGWYRVNKKTAIVEKGI
ncbi:MAG: hypothetical protein WAV23_01375 [Minisyncoccia bacterium]